MYCSVECQKTDWKEGGHKKVCKALQAEKVAEGTVGNGRNAQKRSTTTSRRTLTTTTTTAGASDGRVCIICFEPDPQPIQSGCACRGDAGLAHVECRILAAEHKETSSGDVFGWITCSTCGQSFNGPMALGLAKEHYRRVNGRPTKQAEWTVAAVSLAQSLTNSDLDAQAEAVCRDTRATFARMGLHLTAGQDVSLRYNLARALANQRKDAEAQVLFEACLREFERQLGPDDSVKMDCSMALSDIFTRQHKHAEADAILQDVLERSKRVFGPDGVETLQCGARIGASLFQQNNNNDAIILFKDLLPRVQRVLGPDHPLFLGATTDYGLCYMSCKRYAEAELILVHNLEAQTRVLGPGHRSVERGAQMVRLVRQWRHEEDI
jgi:hypothetical protein